jgi:signal transduction histidine kinase
MNREEFELEDRLATTVFRIVQETLTNVARHSGASEVSVQIDQAEDGIRLAMQDNGHGFSGANDKKTFGLLGMRERIAMLGGRLEIDSGPDSGTRIAAWLPLQKAT